MTHPDKIKYLRIALGLQNIGVSEEISDRIVTTYEEVLKKGGDFSVHDAVEIEMDLDRKYAKQKLKK